MLNRTVRAAVLLVIALFTLAACSNPEPVEMGADTVVIDVRTPSEFSDGHLDGALNIDIASAEFANEIAVLPTDGDYVVYCRSGNRSAQAVKFMREQQFENVLDAGSLNDAAAATGLAVVTN